MESLLQKYIKINSEKNLSTALEYLKLVRENQKLFHIFKIKENFCDIKQTILSAVEQFYEQCIIQVIFFY
jgi:hypothetical protein